MWDTVKDDLARARSATTSSTRTGKWVRSSPGRQGLRDAGRHAQAEHHHDAPHRGGATPTSSTASRPRASLPWWWSTRCSATASSRWLTGPMWSWPCWRRWRPVSSAPWPRAFRRRTCAARIARQITDADRIEAADVVFNNDGTPEELRNEVLAWWNEYKKEL